MGWDFLESKLEEKPDATNDGVISSDAGRATVRDEERMIARSVCRILGLGATRL